ncbi:BC1872 family protein [Anaerobacillus alkalilacustris]|uniref:BC1872 family protein n=1 Tax=Anaerobacillus alkalilacustris TaxID=393763 RepID=UPI0026812F01
MINKKDVIARRIFGWSLNSSGKWFDLEKRTFISDSEFKPDQNLDQAILIVERLQQFGFTYTKKSDFEVGFNDIYGTGDTLAEAITNAAYQLAENSSISDEWL